MLLSENSANILRNTAARLVITYQVRTAQRPRLGPGPHRRPQAPRVGADRASTAIELERVARAGVQSSRLSESLTFGAAGAEARPAVTRCFDQISNQLTVLIRSTTPKPIKVRKASSRMRDAIFRFVCRQHYIKQRDEARNHPL